MAGHRIATFGIRPRHNYTTPNEVPFDLLSSRSFDFPVWLGKEVTILYTNGTESTYEPIDVYWRDDIERI